MRYKQGFMEINVKKSWRIIDMSRHMIWKSRVLFTLVSLPVFKEGLAVIISTPEPAIKLSCRTICEHFCPLYPVLFSSSIPPRDLGSFASCYWDYNQLINYITKNG